MSRMSKERMDAALEQRKTISEADYAKVQAIAEIVRPLRSVIHKTPDDYGMTGWKDLYFSSDDGIPLEGWYIPAKGRESDKFVGNFPQAFSHIALINSAYNLARAAKPAEQRSGARGQLQSGSFDLQKQRDKFALAMCVGLGKDRFQLIARRLP